jgi:hypothetical protein
MTHWLLQCNPDRYDTDHPDWLANWVMARKGLAAKLHPGDQVVIRLSGKDGGVYATARLPRVNPTRPRSSRTAVLSVPRTSVSGSGALI